MSILQLPELPELPKPLLIKRTLSNSAVESETDRDRCHVSVNLARYSSVTTRRSFISRHRHHTLAHWFVICTFAHSLYYIFIINSYTKYDKNEKKIY